MPKLRWMRVVVSYPFSCPIITIGSLVIICLIHDILCVRVNPIFTLFLVSKNVRLSSKSFFTIFTGILGTSLTLV